MLHFTNNDEIVISADGYSTDKENVGFVQLRHLYDGRCVIKLRTDAGRSRKGEKFITFIIPIAELKAAVDIMETRINVKNVRYGQSIYRL